MKTRRRRAKERTGEAGQALVETLVVFPLFVLLAVGALVVGQSLRAKERARAWERAASYSPAAFDPDERRVARWPSLPATLEADARRRKLLHTRGDERASVSQRRSRSDAAHQRRKRQAGSCGDGGAAAATGGAVPRASSDIPAQRRSAANDFCYEGAYDANAAWLGAVGALGPSRWTEGLLKRRSLSFEPVVVLGDLALTPYARRARRYAEPLLAARAASLAESSPVHRRPLPDATWDRGGGFHLDQWLGTRKVAAEETDLERVYVLVAKKARSGQLALCALEAWKETYFVGALWEAFSTASSGNEDAGDGCRHVARMAKGVQAVADGILGMKAVETLALEACGDTQALGGGTGSCSLGSLGAQTKGLLDELGGAKSFSDYAKQGAR